MNEETQLLSSKEPAEQAKTIIQGASKSNKIPNILKNVGIPLGGAAAGGLGVFALMGMTQPTPVDHNGDKVDLVKPEIPDEPKEAEGVTDNMSFQEAFKTARHEVGATGFFEWRGNVYNTLYEGEASLLTKEEQNELYSNIMHEYRDDNTNVAENHPTGTETHVHNDIPVIIHDEAPEAEGVTDEMSFKDAFAVARAEVGPGGVFEWHDQYFNTYTREEFSAMNHEQKSDYLASVQYDLNTEDSVSETEIDIQQIDHPEPQPGLGAVTPGDEPAGVTVTGSNLIAEDYITDPDTGQRIHLGVFEENGEMVLKADTDGDGTFDTTITKDENGNVNFVNDNGESLQISNEEIIEAQQDYDPNADVVVIQDDTNDITPVDNVHFASADHDAGIGSDFDNNADVHMV